MTAQALELLDRALETARGEERALTAGNYDLAGELYAQRVQMTRDAWNLRMDVPVALYRNKLSELSELQKGIMRIARDACETARASLQQTRRQQKRLTAYHKCVRMGF